MAKTKKALTPKPAAAGATKTAQPKVPKAVIVILIVVGILTAIGVLGSLAFLAWFRGSGGNEVAKELGETIQELAEYPDAYRAAGLPEYPGGEVTHFGQKEAKLSDGIFIFVVTGDGLNTVAAFFDDELKAEGWSLKSENTGASDIVVSRAYTKADQELNLSITHDAETNKTNITINWTESGSE